MSTVRLLGKGVNKYWNVHRALETLQGLESVLLLLVRELDKCIVQRDRGAGKDLNLVGTAVSLTMLAAYSAEFAVKTLYAQTNPTKRPPLGHDLLILFDRLEKSVQQEVEEEYLEMESLGGWGTRLGVRATFKIGRRNFEDWRYLSEKDSIGDGVPKPLIDIARAIRKVCLKKTGQV